ncbi:MAG: transcriptional repressor NrdR [Methylophilales bacterium]|jgi:transcriptional repressor NrdR|nr:transcriptional regulator NrdR [Pseudomonadota bacterium]NQW34437.1 transcriptional repressor NrdR [Methylophilales bacterium]HCK03711.1 transcriptional regulator NrdR [Methylophilaceae bacterium]|tara:strand:+ start:12394 stop:12840 length:447 start_codon:yes stop_codon:yes gene_type:complete
MKCPFCSEEDTQVIDSRVNEQGNSIRRRRRCTNCEKRFTTYEHIELSLPQVVKQDGKREEFNRDKLLHSLTRALHKRPVPVEFIDQAVESIVTKILANGDREVYSRDLGEIVMHELKKLDKVAYIRFASVYRSFSDVEDFNNAIKDLD